MNKSGHERWTPAAARREEREPQHRSALIRAPRMREDPVVVPAALGGTAPESEAALAQAELHAQLEAVYARGVAEGRDAIEAAAAEQVEKAVGALLAAGRAFDAERQRLSMNAEVMIRELAVEIAAHVMRAEVESGRPVALELAREAVTRLRNASELEVRVHPADVDLLRLHRGTLIAATTSAVEVVADATIGRGGCRVDGAGMVVDAELRSCLAVIAAELGVEMAPGGVIEPEIQDERSAA